MMEDKEKIDLDLEWEQRTLCSDESCIGTIGPEGYCRECGKAFEGELPEMTREAKVSASTSTVQHDPDDGESEQKEAFGENGIEADAPSDGDWENRTLCSDESCIGVIGPDGCCKECGKPLETGQG